MRSFLLPAFITILTFSGSASVALATSVDSSYTPPDTECKNLEIVFARGSGESLGDTNLKTLQSALKSELGGLKISYNLYDLGANSYGDYSYPASNIDHPVGTYLSAGTSYELGRSIEQGIGELKAYVSEVSTRCPHSKFALAGYSQGAAVVTRALPELDSEKILYVATVGDPKLYLPEGEGLFPKACDGKDLSSYREDVEDCHVSAGILSAQKPYHPSGYSGKVGTWCNANDPICGSSLDLSDIFGAHTDYRNRNTYPDIAKKITQKAKAENFAPSGESGASDNANTPNSEDKTDPSEESETLTRQSVIVFYDCSTYLATTTDEIIMSLVEMKLPSDADITFYLYNVTENAKTYFSKMLEFSPYLLSRKQYIHTYYLSESRNSVIGDAYNSSLNYGENPRVLLVEKSVTELSNSEYLKYVFNTAEEEENDGPLFVYTVGATQPSSVAASHVSLKKVTNFRAAVTKTENATNFSSAAASAGKIRLAAEDTAPISGLTTEGNTLNFRLNLPAGSQGAIILLNGEFVGIADINSLLESNFVITITDLDPAIQNKITVNNIDANGYASSVLTEIEPNLNPGSNNLDSGSGSGSSSDSDSNSGSSSDPNSGSSSDSNSSSTKNNRFENIHVPDCGDARIRE